jgi:hypothetical protein
MRRARKVMGKDARGAAKAERAWLRREAERRAGKARDKDEPPRDRVPATGGPSIEKSG